MTRITQSELFPLASSAGKPERSTRIQSAAGYDANNLRIARAILAGTSEFRCTEIWARLVIQRLGTPEEKAAL